MYQNEMKEGFIKDYFRSRIIQKTTLYGLFRKIEPYEKELRGTGQGINKSLQQWKEIKSKRKQYKIKIFIDKH